MRLSGWMVYLIYFVPSPDAPPERQISRPRARILFRAAGCLRRTVAQYQKSMRSRSRRRCDSASGNWAARDKSVMLVLGVAIKCQRAGLDFGQVSKVNLATSASLQAIITLRSFFQATQPDQRTGVPQLRRSIDRASRRKPGRRSPPPSRSIHTRT